MATNLFLLCCLCCFQSYRYPVEDILGKHDRGVISGPQLVAKLKGDNKANREERIYLVKILAKYLMEKCEM